MIEAKNIAPAVWDAIRAIVRDELGSKPKAEPKPELAAVVTAKKAPSKAKKAAKAAAVALLVIGTGLLFSSPAFAKIRPRNIDSAYDSANWVFGSPPQGPAVQLVPNPSSALTDWTPQTGMIYTDEAGALWFHNGTEWKEVSFE